MSAAAQSGGCPFGTPDRALEKRDRARLVLDPLRRVVGTPGLDVLFDRVSELPSPSLADASEPPPE